MLRFVLLLLAFSFAAPSARAQVPIAVSYSGYGGVPTRDARLVELDREILLLDASIAADPHADDTAPAWMVGLGIPMVALGIAGVVASQVACAESYTVTSSSFGLFGGGGSGTSTVCVRRVLPDEATWAFIAIGAVGITSTILGILWLRANGSRFRQMEGHRRRRDRLEERLGVSASVSDSGAALYVAGMF